MTRLHPLTACLTACVLFAGPALAEYPERPVMLIVPHNPGGGGERGVRSWQPFMEECLGGTLAVTMRPGAGASIGISEAAAAESDGYTIGSLTMPNLVSQAIATELPYTVDSFDYIGSFVGTSATFTVRRDSPHETLNDFLAFAHANTTPVNVAVGGIGNDDHLVGLRFADATDVSVNFVPFGDGATARNALLGGHVDVAIMNNNSAAEFAEEIRGLAIAAPERTADLPDVPTFRELGFDLVGGSNHLLGAPKGTPQEVVSKWRDCVQQVAKDPEYLAVADKQFIPLQIMDAEETEAFVREQDKVFRDIWASDPWVK
jgi:tripartite-type tricarboxylate transporter receptor subunit TctC